MAMQAMKLFFATFCLTIFLSGCGGGNGTPAPNFSGIHAFTLSGYPCGPNCQPIITVNLIQSGNSLTVGPMWSINNFCWALPPQLSEITFSGSVSGKSLTLSIDRDGKNFIPLSSDDFTKRTGTWTQGLEMQTCNVPLTGPMTWTAT
jgi:hypothetical protein